MKHKLISLAIFLAGSLIGFANDSSYNGSGGNLQPVEETDISITKEVLTFTMVNTRYTDIRIEYTFFNPGKKKTVLMGYETDAYNGDFDPITNFQNVFNGKSIPVKINAVEATEEAPEYSAYSYNFKATFPKGESTLVQTFRLKNSNSVSCLYDIPYLLTPATRWANKQIDDFTLVINADDCIKNFNISGDQAILNAKWTGKGAGKNSAWKIEKSTELFYGDDYENPETVPCLKAFVRFASISCHIKDFAPVKELSVYNLGVDLYVNDLRSNFWTFYEPCGFCTSIDRNEMEPDIKELFDIIPYVLRGYVPENQKMREMLESCFWYVPNPAYVPDPADLTPCEISTLEGKSWDDDFPE